MYQVTDKNGNEVHQGDTVTDAFGHTAIFDLATSDGESATVVVDIGVNGSMGRQLYASFFGLTVKEI